MGKVLFALLRRRQDPADKERYRKALYALRAQLATQPRTADGGFWHKKIYPHQIWADGVYMARRSSPASRPCSRARGARRRGEAGPARRGAPARREDGPALSRLGREQEGALGEPDDRAVVAVLGPRRSAGMRWPSPTCWRRCRVHHPQRAAVAGGPAAAGARHRRRAGQGDRRLVASAGRRRPRPATSSEASASAMFVYALTKGAKTAGWTRRSSPPSPRAGIAGIVKQFVGHRRRWRRAPHRDLQGGGPRRLSLPRRQHTTTTSGRRWSPTIPRASARSFSPARSRDLAEARRFAAARRLSARARRGRRRPRRRAQTRAGRSTTFAASARSPTARPRRRPPSARRSMRRRRRGGGERSLFSGGDRS